MYRLAISARLISVDLQEHVTDAQGRALAIGDDDLDFHHVGRYHGMITEVATRRMRATSRLTHATAPNGYGM